MLLWRVQIQIPHTVCTIIPDTVCLQRRLTSHTPTESNLLRIQPAFARAGARFRLLMVSFRSEGYLWVDGGWWTEPFPVMGRQRPRVWREANVFKTSTEHTLRKRGVI